MCGAAGYGVQPNLGGSGGGGHGAWRVLCIVERVMGGALKMPESNMGMHPTAGTPLVIFARGAAAAGDAWR